MDREWVMRAPKKRHNKLGYLSFLFYRNNQPTTAPQDGWIASHASRTFTEHMPALGWRLPTANETRLWPETF